MISKWSSSTSSDTVMALASPASGTPRRRTLTAAGSMKTSRTSQSSVTFSSRITNRPASANRPRNRRAQLKRPTNRHFEGPATKGVKNISTTSERLTKQENLACTCPCRRDIREDAQEFLLARGRHPDRLQQRHAVSPISFHSLKGFLLRGIAQSRQGLKKKMTHF